MIKAKQLTKYYGNFKALDALSIDIKAGEIVGLLGPNGAGKTTTMRLLTGYMPPSAGEIEINGIDLLQHPLEAKRALGYLPEHPPLYPELTVEEYLHFICCLHGIKKKKSKGLIDEALGKTALGDMRKKLLAHLSRGYKQRVGIAQVLVRDVHVMILDEPTIGLDPKQIIEMRDLIKGLAGDYTVILSSHILQEVSATCDRVMIINQGRLVAEDKQERLLLERGGLRRLRLRLKGTDLHQAETALRTLSQVSSVNGAVDADIVTLSVLVTTQADFHADLFKLLKEKGWTPHELTEEKSSLEEVFIKLTEDNA
jgi:ABC-2 type transport system ATP-binding protein